MEIETGVPVPRQRRITKYPFGYMQVGESCFFPGQSTTDRAYRAAKTMGQRRGWVFTGRRVDGGIRIWRVE